MRDSMPSAGSEQEFLPLLALENISRPVLRLFALLLGLTSLWGIINQATLWSRPVKLVVGTAGAVQEERSPHGVLYGLLFTLDTGEELDLRLHNNSPVLDYFLTSPTTDTIALRYWTDDMSVAAVHPLVVGVAPIRDRFPPSDVLLATSVLGLLMALVLLFAGRLHRSAQHPSALPPSGRHGRRSARR